MVKTFGEGTAVTRVPEGGFARWGVFDEFAELRHKMDELFSRSFGYTPLSRLLPNEPYVYEPIVDIYETENAVELFVGIPGFLPESIKVEALPESISIEGERKPLYNEKAIPVRQGWVAFPVSFCVNYALPSKIDPNLVTATFLNGILHLIMPKTELARKHAVPVKVMPS